MAPNIQKIEALIRLAVDKGASSEEARTAAFLAVQMINSNNLLGTLKSNSGGSETNKKSTYTSSKQQQTNHQSPKKSKPKQKKSQIDFSPLVDEICASGKADAALGVVYEYLMKNRNVVINFETIVKEAWDQNTIYDYELEEFKRYLRHNLHYYVKKGSLASKRGRNGGYKWA